MVRNSLLLKLTTMIMLIINVPHNGKKASGLIIVCNVNLIQSDNNYYFIYNFNKYLFKLHTLLQIL